MGLLSTCRAVTDLFTRARSGVRTPVERDHSVAPDAAT